MDTQQFECPIQIERDIIFQHICTDNQEPRKTESTY